MPHRRLPRRHQPAELTRRAWWGESMDQQVVMEQAIIKVTTGLVGYSERSQTPNGDPVVVALAALGRWGLRSHRLFNTIGRQIAKLH